MERRNRIKTEAMKRRRKRERQKRRYERWWKRLEAWIDKDSILDNTKLFLALMVILFVSGIAVGLYIAAPSLIR